MYIYVCMYILELDWAVYKGVSAVEIVRTGSHFSIQEQHSASETDKICVKKCYAEL